MWHALESEALLDHVNRGDARHALKLLLDALARRLGHPCTLRAEAGDGKLRWKLQGVPGAAASPADVPAQATTGANELPLSRLGRHVGMRQLPIPAGIAPPAPEATLEPVLHTAAALLLNDAAPSSGHGPSIRAGSATSTRACRCSATRPRRRARRSRTGTR